ncbi:MAG: polysaccharide lyase [Myxococcales bacterium]
MPFYSRLVLVAAVLFVSSQAAAEVVWRGDFECGDLSQWTRSQSVSPDRLEVQEGGSGKGGRFALKATVVQGDNPIGASGNRNELTYTSYEPSGTERFYRWQTRFADDYPSANAWQLFTQWHHAGPSGSPPVEFFVRKEEIILNVVGESVWRMPLERGRWIDFVFHVKWSPDASEGFVELYVDGKQVLAPLHRATQFPGELNYLKQGLYRDASIQETGVVFHDGMIIGTSLADVMPETVAVSQPPAGPIATTEDAQAPQPRPLAPSSPTHADPSGSSEVAAAGCSSGSGSPMAPVAAAVVAGGVFRRRRLSTPVGAA